MDAMTRLAKAQAQIDAARAEIELALVDLLRAATVEIAARYPGYRILGCSAMGSWNIMVYGVQFTDDGHAAEVGADFVGDCYKHDVEFRGAAMCKYNHYERPNEALTAFDDAWSDYQTYPTVRFDVDEQGNLTSKTDW